MLYSKSNMALSTKPGRSVSPKIDVPAPSGEAATAVELHVEPAADSSDLPNWRRSLREAVRDPAELLRLLELPSSLADPARRAAEQFGLFVPRGYLARMRRGDPADPLLRQVLPLGAELEPARGFTADPVGDAAVESAPGLLRKYHGRALLITTGACAVHCRYCFRRHFPYDTAPKSLADWRPALDEIAADPTISEVILSGGDPWTLVDDVLEPLARRIATIEHVRRLRVHTRLPVFIPERVCDSLLSWFGARRRRPTPICVIHANHAAELDDSVAGACERLRSAGVLLLNQTVLLRGVNDSVEALTALSERLVELRVTPYYLHQLDRVAGAAHFEVPESDGVQLVEALRRRLPGYAVPRYVRETPGAASKLPLERIETFA